MKALHRVVVELVPDGTFQARVVGPLGKVGGLADHIDVADPDSRESAARWLHDTSGIPTQAVITALELEWLRGELGRVA